MQSCRHSRGNPPCPCTPYNSTHVSWAPNKPRMCVCVCVRVRECRAFVQTWLMWEWSKGACRIILSKPKKTSQMMLLGYFHILRAQSPKPGSPCHRLLLFLLSPSSTSTLNPNVLFTIVRPGSRGGLALFCGANQSPDSSPTEGTTKPRKAERAPPFSGKRSPHATSLPSFLQRRRRPVVFVLGKKCANGTSICGRDVPRSVAPVEVTWGDRTKPWLRFVRDHLRSAPFLRSPRQFPPFQFWDVCMKGAVQGSGLLFGKIGNDLMHSKGFRLL